MATVRNNAGEERFIPVVGLLVADGASFEVPDAIFDLYDWGADFDVKSTPARKPTENKEK